MRHCRGTLGAAVRAGLIMLVVSGSAAAEPAGDLGAYVLLGIESVSVDDRAFLGAGHVGANQSSGVVRFGRFGFVLESVVADTTRLGQGTSVFDLFTNDLQSPLEEIVIRATGPTGFTPPILAALPPLPAFAPGTADLTVRSGTVVVLSPGAFRDLRVARGGTLVLSGGTYELNSLITGRLSKVLVTDVATVNIANELRIGHLAAFGPSAMGVDAEDVDVHVGGDVVAFGSAAHVSIDLLAPNARVNIGRSIHGSGRFVGKTIVGDATLNLRAPRGGASSSSSPLEFCTLTQDVYGAAAGAANGPAGLVTANPGVLPVTIGATGVLSLSIPDQSGLVCFLPGSGTAAALCTDRTACAGDMVVDACASPPIVDFDPAGDGASGGQGAGSLAGDLIAAKLNVALSEFEATPPGFAGFILPERLCTTRCPDGREIDPNDMEFQTGAVDSPTVSRPWPTCWHSPTRSSARHARRERARRTSRRRPCRPIPSHAPALPTRCASSTSASTGAPSSSPAPKRPRIDRGVQGTRSGVSAARAAEEALGEAHVSVADGGKHGP